MVAVRLPIISRGGRFPHADIAIGAL